MSGDEGYEQLVLSQQRPLWRYLRFLGARSSEAERLARETFLEVMQRPFEPKNPQAAGGYLRSVARHKLLTAFARAGQAPVVPDLDQADAEWAVFAGESGGEERVAALRAGEPPPAEPTPNQVRMFDLAGREARGEEWPPDLWHVLKRRFQAPTQIEHYRILGEIARGAMGVVYRAHDPSMNRQVAIKLIRVEKEDARHRKRFRAEARALAKLNHPNVVRVHSAGDHEGSHYMIMRLVEGESLQEQLEREGPLDPLRAASLCAKIAWALDHCHGQAVLHRDLKPHNVLVDREGEPHLTDFGLAQDLDTAAGSSITYVGTPGYWPPEQARGEVEAIGPHSDVYSLGATLYALLCGRPPYAVGSSFEEAAGLLDDPLQPPSSVRPLDPELEAIVLRCLAHPVEDRYPSARVLAEALELYVANATPPPPPPKRAISARISQVALPTLGLPTVRVRSSFAIAGAVLLAAGAVALALVLFDDQRERLRLAAAVEVELELLKESGPRSLAEARENLAEGERAFREGRLDGALQAAGDTLAIYDLWAGQFDRLEHPEQNGAPAASVKAEHAEPMRAVAARALSLRARALLRSGGAAPIARAQQAIDGVPAERGRTPPASIALAQAEIHHFAGKLDAAREWYRKVPAGPLQGAALLGEGRVLLLQGEAEAASAVLSRALRALSAETPSGVRGEALIARAQAWLRLGRLERAGQDARAARAITGWRAPAVEGAVLLARGRLFAAREAFAAAVALAPRDPGPHLIQAEALLRAGRAREAWRSADRAVVLRGASWTALALRADAAEQALRVEESEADAVRVEAGAQALDWRARARANRVLARLLFSDGPARALGPARRGVDLDPHGSAGRLLLARLQLSPEHQGQYLAQAERELKRVLRRRRDSVRAVSLLGLLLQKKHARQPERSRRRFLEALKLDPRNGLALAGLASVARVKARGARGPSRGRLYDQARALAGRAARAAQDVRRAEGRAYALGLRAARRAQRAEGPEQQRLRARARRALLRAVWLNPLHLGACRALVGLARAEGDVAREQRWRRLLGDRPRFGLTTGGSDARAGRLLERAQEARQAGNAWAGLNAFLRAVFFRDDRLGDVLGYLRRAGRTSPPEGWARDPLRPPVDGPVELDRLLAAAPTVAKALAAKVDAAEGRQAFAALEHVLERDPDRLLPRLLLGALAWGVRRNDYAVSHLMFVAAVHEPPLAEASYLAAVALARGNGDPARDALAIECLQAANSAGLAWRPRAAREPDLKRLRGSPLWKRLGR